MVGEEALTPLEDAVNVVDTAKKFGLNVNVHKHEELIRQQVRILGCYRMHIRLGLDSEFSPSGTSSTEVRLCRCTPARRRAEKLE